ncbi:MAG: flagellar motor protein MotB [Spirochaetes bacterium GWD1_27_9]|nr:MAG: flagellar motor protein MotB [Spirochaetes bacterium GWB1_27_13]OHD27915.1 MAG: flagellar motor protein MotB [Spirochaetes bacterium GWC1_27_15]OHD39282.1 MAG: flagellar motor protein MotB [Spirochaetes bacterium GWD1_27_9]
MAREKKKKCPEGTADWLLTFGDLNSLLLTFFVLLVSQAHFDVIEIQMILSPFQGSFGVFAGGKTLTPGRFADLGNTLENLPSTDKGRGMAKAYKEAVSVFQAEIKSRKVVVDITERGITISLAADAYFKKASAELDIEAARSVLEKLVALFNRADFRDKNIRIEGHTDDVPTDINGPWPTNWHLSTARSLNVLDYLVDFGANPKKFGVVGYGEYQPIFPNDTEEHRSKNRRVDIVILREI